jgi:hypothetical protein
MAIQVPILCKYLHPPDLAQNANSQEVQYGRGTLGSVYQYCSRNPETQPTDLAVVHTWELKSQDVNSTLNVSRLPGTYSSAG